MKILAICSAIDLSHPGGGVPVWWQMLKGLHEMGAEVIVIPSIGRSLASPWWSSYKKPFYNIQDSALWFLMHSGRAANQKLGKYAFERGWKKHLTKIFRREREIDVVLLLSVPNLATKIPSWIRKKFHTPTVYYSSDIQNIPKYSLDHRPEKHKFPDLSECDAVVCSFRAISSEFKQRGIQPVWVIPFGADPTIFRPIEIRQDIDILFSGYGSLDREDWIRFMISNPSKLMKEVNFVVEGSFRIDLGLAKRIPSRSLDRYIHFCRRSKINLSILRQQFINASVLNSRIFELASLGCCVVTNPCKSLESFFEPDKEVVVVHNEKEAIQTYKWLLSSEEVRLKIGKAARHRVLAEHTYLHRAKQLLNLFRKLPLVNN